MLNEEEFFMSKTFQKIVAAAMSVAMIATLFTACGGNAQSGEKVLKIGGIGPTTGPCAVYGEAVRNGAQLAVDEINANGGVNGFKLELDFQDDENDVEKAVNAYNNLKDGGMHVLLGTVTTNPCLAVIDYTKGDNIFQITPSASAQGVTKNDNAFQVCFSDPNQGTASANYIADNQLATKVAVIYDSSDSYSSGIYNTFKTQAAERNIEIVSEKAFTSESAQDFSAQLTDAKSKGAELIFLPIYAKEAALLLGQASKMGITAKFFGCDGLDGVLSQEGFDQKLAENVMLLTPFAKDATDEKTQDFVKAYRAKYNNDDSTLNQFAADAYDAVYIIKAACEKANVNLDMTASEICDALKGAMATLKVDGVTGEGMQWDGGAVNKAPKAVKIVNGSYTAMD